MSYLDFSTDCASMLVEELSKRVGTSIASGSEVETFDSFPTMLSTVENHLPVTRFNGLCPNVHFCTVSTTSTKKYSVCDFSY